MRPHLSYANVTATLALVVALATGGAYAADLIGSDEIRNDSVRSVDLRDGLGVRGADVRVNTLGRREVNERQLGGAQIVQTAGRSDLACELTPTFVDCVTTQVRLRQPGKVLAVATGAFHGDGSANAVCELQLDGGGDAVGQTPGETAPTTDSVSTDGFARTQSFSAVPAGSHDVALACREVTGEVAIDSSTVAAIGLTNR